MTSLYIEGTRWTPTIVGDENSALTISGESQPEDAVAFFEPVFVWITKTLQLTRRLTISLKLSYYNTSTAKILSDIMGMLNDAYRMDAQVSVTWYVQHEDDADMLESIEEYQQDFEIPITVITPQ